MLLKYPIYSPFLTLQEHGYLLAHNVKGYINSSSAALKRQMFSILTNEYDYTKIMGGYLYNKVNRVDSLVASQKSSVNQETYTAISPENIKYLKRIIEFCHENNKLVYLVRTPTHKAFVVLRNEKTFQEIRHKYFDSIPFLFFSKFPVKDTEFADLEHLNYYGASKYSIWFESLLKAGLLSKIDKQGFINEELMTYKENH